MDPTPDPTTDPPKRKYTLTAKALAANRANLVKARAVPESVRFRTTVKRTAACHRNLARARETLAALGDASPAYGTHFRRGVSCLSLGRSAAKSGERRQDYDHYLKLFDWAVAPQDAIERKLTRGLAGSVWRRLRALNGQAHWERQCLGYRLEQAARGVYPDMAGSLTARRDSLADEIGEVLSTDYDLVAAVEKTQGRVELLWRELDRHVNPAGPRLEYRTRRRGWGEARWAEVSEAALGNAYWRLRSASKIAQRFAAAKSAADLEDRSALQSLGAEPEPRLGDEAYWRDLVTPPGRRAWYAPKSCGSPLATFEEFARLFEKAFQAGSRIATAKSGEEFPSAAPAESPPANCQDPELARAIELVWSRLGVYRERANQERARVEALLEQAIRARAAGRDRAAWIRESATAMVGLLGGYGQAMRRGIELERALFEALTAYRTREREKEAQQEEQEEADEEASPDSAADSETEARENAAHEAEAARQLEELKSLQQTLAWLDSRSAAKSKGRNKARPKAGDQTGPTAAPARPPKEEVVAQGPPCDSAAFRNLFGKKLEKQA